MFVFKENLVVDVCSDVAGGVHPRHLPRQRHSPRRLQVVADDSERRTRRPEVEESLPVLPKDLIVIYDNGKVEMAIAMIEKANCKQQTSPKSPWSLLGVTTLTVLD